eukprot:SAG22_NODE_2493_length_2513_cov_1.264292_2_plen_781_part_01
MAGVGGEALWLDAYWFEGAFPNGVGNWTQPPELAIDRARFPDGLRGLSSAVHDKGLQFLLWFEPERLHATTWLRRNFPEYALPADASEPPDALLNLGDAEARGYITEYLSDAIQDFGMSVFRTDFNIQPASLWLGPPYPDNAMRRGMNEAKYIAGLYEMWDEVRRRHGDLLIDNCASGGRRIDLETVSRSVPLWRTDYDGVGGCCSWSWAKTCAGACKECSGKYGCGKRDDAAAQSMSMGLSQFVAIHSGPVSSWDPYEWRSTGVVAKVIYWGGAGYEHLLANASAMKVAQLAVNETKSLRAVALAADAEFFPIHWGGTRKTWPDGTVEITPTDDTWAAYQYHSSAVGGFAMFFRRELCRADEMRFDLRGLRWNASYTVVRCFGYTCEPAVTLAGSELANTTIKLLSPASSLLLRYTVAKFALKTDDGMMTALMHRDGLRPASESVGTVVLVGLRPGSSRGLPILGFGNEIVEQNVGDSALARAAAAAGSRAPRYPGGAQSDGWDWKIGCAMSSLTPAAAGTPGQCEKFYSTVYGKTPPEKWAEYVNQSSFESAGTIGLPVTVFDIDVVSTNASYQVEGLQRMAALGVPVELVEFGNELYAWQQNGGKWSDGAGYAAAMRPYLEAVATAFPDAKTAVVGSGWWPGFDTNWNRAVLENTSATAATFHVYTLLDTAGISDTTVADRAPGVLTADAVNADANASIPQRLRIWVTEFGEISPGYTNTLEIDDTWLQGLYISAATMLLLRDSRVDVALPYCLVCGRIPSPGNLECHGKECGTLSAF